MKQIIINGFSFCLFSCFTKCESGTAEQSVSEGFCLHWFAQIRVCSVCVSTDARSHPLCKWRLMINSHWGFRKRLMCRCSCNFLPLRVSCCFFTSHLELLKSRPDQVLQSVSDDWRVTPETKPFPSSSPLRPPLHTVAFRSKQITACILWSQTTHLSSDFLLIAWSWIRPAGVVHTFQYQMSRSHRALRNNIHLFFSYNKL